MFAYQFGHFKHADAVFAPEEFAQFVVGLNKRFVLRVLQIVAANVIPKLPRDFGAWDWLAADDLGQLRIGLHGFHESGARLTFSFSFCWCNHNLPLNKA